MLALGILSGIITGVCTPANTFLFGRLTDSMITQGSNMLETEGGPPPNIDELNDAFWDEIKFFATFNSVVGAIMLIFSYTGIMLFNYAAHNQVGKVQLIYH